jgi:hypothetical protein
MSDAELEEKKENDMKMVKKLGGRPDETDNYGYYSYEGMEALMKKMVKEYGEDLVKLETA